MTPDAWEETGEGTRNCKWWP